MTKKLLPALALTLLSCAAFADVNTESTSSDSSAAIAKLFGMPSFTSMDKNHDSMVSQSEYDAAMKNMQQQHMHGNSSTTGMQDSMSHDSMDNSSQSDTTSMKSGQ